MFAIPEDGFTSRISTHYCEITEMNIDTLKYSSTGNNPILTMNYTEEPKIMSYNYKLGLFIHITIKWSTVFES